MLLETAEAIISGGAAGALDGERGHRARTAEDRAHEAQRRLHRRAGRRRSGGRRGGRDRDCRRRRRAARCGTNGRSSQALQIPGLRRSRHCSPGPVRTCPNLHSVTQLLACGRSSTRPPATTPGRRTRSRSTAIGIQSVPSRAGPSAAPSLLQAAWRQRFGLLPDFRIYGEPAHFVFRPHPDQRGVCPLRQFTEWRAQNPSTRAI